MGSYYFLYLNSFQTSLLVAVRIMQKIKVTAETIHSAPFQETLFTNSANIYLVEMRLHGERGSSLS